MFLDSFSFPCRTDEENYFWGNGKLNAYKNESCYAWYSPC